MSLLDRIPSSGDSCCFCFSSGTGTKIIGYLGILGGISEISSTAAQISQNTVSGGYGAVGIIQAIFFLVVSVFLVLGAHKKNGNYMIIWIYVTLLLILINLIIGIVGIFLGTIAVLSWSICYAVLHFYFVMVVNTHRIELETGMPTYN